MRANRCLASVVLAGGLVLGPLAACGDGDEPESEETPSATASVTSSPTPTASASPTANEVDFGKPARGPKITGSTYTYRVPKGWIDNTESAREINSEIDTSGAEADGSDGFRNNVTVTSIVAAGGNLDDLEADITVQLEAVAKQIELRDRVLVDHRPMARHAGVIKAKPVNYVLDQYAGIDEEGRVTVIAFSYARDVPPKVRDRSTNAILASWAW